jgi:hypothetical protein
MNELEFNQLEIELILKGLQELPYKDSSVLIHKIIAHFSKPKKEEENEK